MLALRATIHQQRLRNRREQLREDPYVPRLSGLSRAEEDQVFADLEQHLNQVVATENGSEPRVTSFAMRGAVRTRPFPISVEETWPVKVSLHSVDWKNMTLTGTMTAINIPGRSRVHARTSETGNEEDTKSNSMESLFDGEIIDFRHHELETVAHKKGYTVGGPGVDVRYWAGVGPFKVAIDRAKQLRLDKKRNDALAQRQNNLPNDSGRERIKSSLTTWLDHDHPRIPADQTLTKDEEDEVTDATMYSCLGGEKWFKENMKEWILMRWKGMFNHSSLSHSTLLTLSLSERCFVTGLDSPPRSDPPSVETPLEAILSESSTTYTPFRDSTWGLTISGFYYIALHRQTGRVEGLYYDPTSQPFQRLEMYPKDLYGEGDSRDVKKGQIRKEFPVFEFR